MTSDRPPRRLTDRWDRLSLLAALLVFAGILLFKTRAFDALGYGGDAILHTQIARSWLEGRPPLSENFFGTHLGTHTYFLLLPLGILALPLGTYGLFVAQAALWGLGVLAAARLLRLHGLPGAAALPISLALLLSPAALHTVHDWQYGFHVELLEPPLALFLALALARRRARIALLATLVLLSVKEDAPLLAIAIAALALVEDRFFSPRRDWNRAALLSLLLSVAAFPALLAFLKVHPRPVETMAGLERLRLAWEAGARSYTDLAFFVLLHAPEWIASEATARLAAGALAASFGLLLLRPHAFLFLPLFSLVPWLMRDDPTWASRFAPALALVLCSVPPALGSLARRGAFTRPAALGGLALAAAFCAAISLAWLFPRAADVYRMDPWSYYTEEQRRSADAAFADVERLVPPDAPVVAHVYLFKYAHRKNLFWFYGMRPGVSPEWILWDLERPSFENWGFPARRYTLVERCGPFALFQRLHPAPPPGPDARLTDRHLVEDGEDREEVGAALSAEDLRAPVLVGEET